MKKNIDRRKFFLSAGLSALGLAVINKFPISLFSGKKNRITKEIKLNIHPSAVKRTK